jgi:hypothetical protein
MAIKGRSLVKRFITNPPGSVVRHRSFPSVPHYEKSRTKNDGRDNAGIERPVS